MNDVRLLYVSKFKDERYSTSELYNILTEALEFNELHKIFGALYLIIIILSSVWKALKKV